MITGAKYTKQRQNTNKLEVLNANEDITFLIGNFGPSKERMLLKEKNNIIIILTEEDWISLLQKCYSVCIQSYTESFECHKILTVTL